MSFNKKNNNKNNNQLNDIDYEDIKKKYEVILRLIKNNEINLDDDEILKIQKDFELIQSFLNQSKVQGDSENLNEDIFSIEAKRIANFIQNHQSFVVDDLSDGGLVDDVVVDEKSIVSNSPDTLIDDEDKEIVIKVENVTMEYKIVKEKIDTIKEFVIRSIKRNKKSSTMFTALKNISFEIQKGDRVGIVGFNGAGKSTLLKLLSGVYYPTKGTIEIKGKLAPLLELGAGFDNNYTGKANIFLNGAFLGFSESFLKDKYDEILEFSELGESINYPVKNYSSGMRAKLGFSIATLVEPDILIIDEILSVGDVKFQKKSSEKLRSLINSGITVLLVSHSPSQIREICNQAIWIDKGEIMMMGDVNVVCDAYEKVARGLSINELKNDN